MIKMPKLSKLIGFVEDNKDIRTIMEMMLSSYGYKVVLGETGEDAIKLVNQYPLDALVMDNSMPTMNGLTALGKIRIKNKTLPILIASGDDVETEAREYGATDFLKKEYTPKQLIAKLNELLQ